MEKLFAIILVAFALQTNSIFAQEDKNKRVSPPATVTQTLENGNKIIINYSRPFLRNRTVGIEVATLDSVWRTGANEAATIEISKPAKIKGKLLPAGKYALFTIPGKKKWTIIFNKRWDQWGAYEYNKNLDALRIKVRPEFEQTVSEQFTIEIDKKGEVELNWGNTEVEFTLK